MVGLADLMPPKRKVRGVEVSGITVRGVGVLLARFESVRKLMVGHEVDAAMLLKVAPEAVASIIACGVGKPGDEATEAQADALPIEVQFDLVEAIIAETVPSGFGPFAERLGNFSSAFGLRVQPEPSDAPSTKAQATTSPSGSKSSSKRVTRLK